MEVDGVLLLIIQAFQLSEVHGLYVQLKTTTLLPKNFRLFLFSNFLTTSVPDEGYSRNVSIGMSTFLFKYQINGKVQPQESIKI